MLPSATPGSFLGILGPKIPNLIPFFEEFFIPNPALTSHVLFAASSSLPSPWRFGRKAREKWEFCVRIMRHEGIFAALDLGILGEKPEKSGNFVAG